MRAERVVRRMLPRCAPRLQEIESVLRKDPPDLLPLSELERKRMQLRIAFLKWVLEEGPWPGQGTTGP